MMSSIDPKTRGKLVEEHLSNAILESIENLATREEEIKEHLSNAILGTWDKRE